MSRIRKVDLDISGCSIGMTFRVAHPAKADDIIRFIESELAKHNLTFERIDISRPYSTNAEVKTWTRKDIAHGIKSVVEHYRQVWEKKPVNQVIKLEEGGNRAIIKVSEKTDKEDWRKQVSHSVEEMLKKVRK